MSKWIDYKLDGRFVENPKIVYPTNGGGKGNFYVGDKNVYLGGALHSGSSIARRLPKPRYMPLQPTPLWNSTRIARFFYD